MITRIAFTIDDEYEVLVEPYVDQLREEFDPLPVSRGKGKSGNDIIFNLSADPLEPEMLEDFASRVKDTLMQVDDALAEGDGLAQE